jgi:hypothetical protein
MWSVTRVSKVNPLGIKTLVLASIIGTNGILLFNNNSIHGTMDFLNDSHFITNNLTEPKLTPEEMKRAEELSSSIIEALRIACVDMPALNDSKKGVIESEVTHAQQLIEKSKELNNLTGTN